MSLSTIASWASSAVSMVADWTGSSVVDNLVSTAYSYLLDRMLPADSEAELKRLQTALPQITAVMDIAEALKMKDPSASLWVNQFRQAVEASEYVLDELEYKRLEDMGKNRDKAGGSASSSKNRKSCIINDDTLERLKEAVTMLDQAAAETERLLQTDIDRDLFVLPNNLIKKSLRLLKACGSKYCELPMEISYLVHLRYLSIELDYKTQSFEYLFPVSIYKLYHLQVLELSHDGDYSGN